MGSPLAGIGPLLRASLLGLAPLLLVCCGGSGAPASDAATDGASNDQSADSFLNDLNDDHPTGDAPGQPDAQPDAVGDAPMDGPVDVPAVTPTITALSPTWLSIGSPDLYFTLMVYGQDLPDQAYVVFDGNLFTAQLVSPTQLQVSIPTVALGSRPRLVPVLVERKLPPDLSSNTLYFEVTAMDAGPGN